MSEKAKRTVFFAFQPVEYLVREGKHFELTGETVSILINTYDNLERLISIICDSPRWSLHERAGKKFWKILAKSNILRNIALKPGTFLIMKYNINLKLSIDHLHFWERRSQNGMWTLRVII